jgi:cytoskeletal protein CcmA (bactofilin family)
LTIKGNVSSTGELHINGRIKGDVSCAAAILGETSAIEGNVAAEEAAICGRLVGSMGRRVMLQSTAHVEGDILHQDLAMEQGAYFDGRSRRSKDALSATDLRRNWQSKRRR